MLIVSFFKRPLCHSSVGLSLASVSVSDLTLVNYSFDGTSSREWAVWFVPLWTITPRWNGVFLAIFQDLAVVFRHNCFHVVHTPVRNLDSVSIADLVQIVIIRKALSYDLEELCSNICLHIV